MSSPPGYSACVEIKDNMVMGDNFHYCANFFIKPESQSTIEYHLVCKDIPLP